MEQESKSMEMREVVELLPCPFCGASVCEIAFDDEGTGPEGGRRARVECSESESCFASTGWQDDIGTAVAAWNARTPDHAAAMKAAQDAIAVEKRALLNANAALREDTERMRVMREALEVAAIGVEKSDMSRVPSLVRAWIHEAKMKRRAALASTAPAKRCGCGRGPNEACEKCNGTDNMNAASTAPVAEAGQKEGE